MYRVCWLVYEKMLLVAFVLCIWEDIYILSFYVGVINSVAIYHMSACMVLYVHVF